MNKLKCFTVAYIFLSLSYSVNGIFCINGELATANGLENLNELISVKCPQPTDVCHRYEVHLFKEETITIYHGSCVSSSICEQLTCDNLAEGFDFDLCDYQCCSSDNCNDFFLSDESPSGHPPSVVRTTTTEMPPSRFSVISEIVIGVVSGVGALIGLVASLRELRNQIKSTRKKRKERMSNKSASASSNDDIDNLKSVQESKGQSLLPSRQQSVKSSSSNGDQGLKEQTPTPSRQQSIKSRSSSLSEDEHQSNDESNSTNSGGSIKSEDDDQEYREQFITLSRQQSIKSNPSKSNQQSDEDSKSINFGSSANSEDDQITKTNSENESISKSIAEDKHSEKDALNKCSKSENILQASVRVVNETAKLDNITSMISTDAVKIETNHC